MIEIIGYIGGAFISIQLLPQLHKTFTSKDATSLSLPFMCCNICGLGCMGIYGFFNNDLPLILPTVISLCNTLILVVLKLKYNEA